MKAAVLNAIGTPFEIEEVELDTPKGREVLIDVKASGLCHSDLNVMENDYGFPLPLIMGHEVAGVVAEIGPDVTQVAVGDHVVMSIIATCLTCEACMDGRSWHCSNPDAIRRGPGEAPRITRGGEPVTQMADISGFAERALTHENQLVVINKDIPFDRAALLGCGVVTGAGSAINSAGVRVGEDVAIIGCGGVGLNVVQGARIAGAHRIIAIDLEPAKLELAKTFGATHTINPREVDDVPAAVREITGSGGVDKAFEVIGLKATAEQAIDLLKMGGDAYMVGMQKPGVKIEIDGWNDLLLQQKGVKGVLMGSTNAQRDVKLYADMYTEGRFNLDDLVSKTIRLEDINDAYEELQSGKIARSVIVFD